MAETKFTPGPWCVNSEPYVDVRADNGRLLVAAFTTEANARLIAAAPNLYATLGRVEAVMSIVEPRSDKKEYLETLAEVRAALAKARGEP